MDFQAATIISQLMQCFILNLPPESARGFPDATQAAERRCFARDLGSLGVLWIAGSDQEKRLE